MATEIVPKIETTWGCLIELDLEVLQEAAARADLTIGHVGIQFPNALKQAAHYAFWLRKLKPLRVLNVAEHAEVTRQLIADRMLSGSVDKVQSTVPPPRRLYVNEAFALLAAIGIARSGGYSAKLNESIFNDLVVSLRYNSFSPSALTAMLNAYVP